jgi:uncharacterized repeat protein (TIGR02543 family)
MASCITAQFGDKWCPQLRLTVTESSSTTTSVTLSWKLEYVAHGYAAYTRVNKSYSAVVAGQTVASGSYDINGRTGTTTINSGTKVINKGTSAQTISFSCSMAFDLTWNGTYGGTKTASGSISIAAKTAYKISYNANGGSGAPGAQTKWAGTNITLSSSKPTRTGYSFQGWATSSGGSVAYAPGATYSENESVTLYAVWKANTYTVSYNANGGSGAPGAQTKTYGVTLKLSTTKPTRTNYNFLGWGTSASSTTVAYAAGANYTNNNGITLYAIWQLAYTAPRFTNLNMFRCGSDGRPSEEGTYGFVSFNWKTDKTVSSIKIEWKASGASTYTNNVTVSGTGTTGAVTKIFGSNSIDTETSYDVRVTVTDSIDSSYVTGTIEAMTFEIDFLSGGGGVAFGKPADKKGFQVKMPAEFLSRFDFKNTAYDKYTTPISNGICNHTSDGIDPNTTNLELIVTHKNTPAGTGVYMIIRTMFYGNKTATSNRAQYAIPYNENGSMYHRYYANGAWTSWRRHLNADESIAPANHNHPYYTTASANRFQPGWIGFYANANDAIAHTNRKGWIGHDTTNSTFSIKNESGNYIKFLVKSGSGLTVGGVPGGVYPPINGQEFLGYSNSRWTTVYAVNGTISTSDKNYKKEIVPLDQKYTDMFNSLKPVRYKLTYKNSDRIHVGFIAQDVKESMDQVGLTAMDFAGYCRDVKQEWSESKERFENVLDENGNEQYIYSLRYGEFIALNTHMIQKQQKRIDDLEKQIQELKELVLNLSKNNGE